MSTVFVSQETLKKNHTTGYMQQMPSLAPAEEFGEVQVLLGFSEALDMGDVKMLWTLRERLAMFSDSDYILPLGSPTVMALTVALAAEINHGRVKILQWDRETSRYIVREFDLHAQPTQEMENVGR